MDRSVASVAGSPRPQPDSLSRGRLRWVEVDTSHCSFKRLPPFFLGAWPSHSRGILPRSRHRPVAVKDGSRIKNLNKTAVRLWT
jgi:hypothetical protein